MKFKIEQFKADVSQKRQDIGLRELGKEIDVSPSTLSRLENGKMPDLLTYAKICQWLGVGLNKYFDDTYNKKLIRILKDIVVAQATTERSGEAWALEMVKDIDKL